MQKTKLKTLLTIGFALLTHTLTQAQTYPQKPIKLVVPYTAGGISDILSRMTVQAMGEKLSQPIIVDNKPGAGAALGADFVAKSSPDGYTLLLGASSTHVLNPLLYKLNYDPDRDFLPIGLMASTPLVLVISSQFQASNLAELLAWLKSHPGQTNFGSYGNASASHLAGELFKSYTGVDMQHVPYKGASPALNDLVAGQITLMFSDMSAMQFVKSGRLRALAITSFKRSEFNSELPTIAELAPTGSGLEGYGVTGWFALYAPAATPRPIVEKLNTALVEAINSHELKTKISGLGLEPNSSSPEALSALMKTEHDKWQKVIASAKIKVE